MDEGWPFREPSALNANPGNPEPEAQRRSWRRSAWLGGCVGLLAALAVQIGHLTLGNNFRTVVPGQVYRCAQLTDGELEQAIGRHGIRTVVNLRGMCFGCDWYTDESRTTHRCDVSQEDVNLSASRLPPVTELHQLLRALDQSAYPILIHCRQGVDRTGLVSAVVLLLYTDADLETARGELRLCYGHVPLGRTTQMFRFFRLYEAWLKQQGLQHARSHFRRWLAHEYCPGPSRARLELLDSPECPPLGRPWSVRVRATNLSKQAWQFRPGNTAGVHCGYVLTDDRGNCLTKGRAGLFLAEVPPGQSIDLTLTLPTVRQAGPYILMVDMLDEEQQCYFYQNGSQPLVREFQAGPPSGADSPRTGNTGQR